MKTSNVIIRIAEPCHENWNAMLPHEKGKFCTSCSKPVIDFTKKTDAEIGNILEEHKGIQLCGHLKKSQLDRPIQLKINLNELPKYMSITKVFAVALFIVFGTVLFSCTDETGKKVESIELINDIENQNIMGMMLAPVAEEKMVKKDSIINCGNDTNVDGAMSYEGIPYIDSTENKIEEVQQIEYVTMGAMVYYSEPQVNNILDSTNDSDQYFKEDKINLGSKDFIVYPNPSNGEFTISYNLKKNSDVNISIFDSNGSFIKNVVDVNGQYQSNYKIPVNLSDLPNGIYIVSFMIDGKQTIERVVITN